MFLCWSQSRGGVCSSQVVWILAASTRDIGNDAVLREMWRLERQQALRDGHVASVSLNWCFTVSRGFQNARQSHLKLLLS